MTRYLLPSALLLAGGLSPSFAGEHEVQPGAFEKVVHADVTLLPVDPVTFSLEPESWSSFTIEEVVPHGAAVEKGQAIIVFDTEPLDRKLHDEREGARVRKMNLADARRELANLEVSTPRKLEVSERTHHRAQEDLEYFRAIGREERELAVHRSVERAERQLEYQQEELTQLLAMYREDDLTEETEEIILKRQRNSVHDAEEMVRRSRLSREKTLEVDLPREAQDLEQKAMDAELSWDSARETLPRALDKKRIAVAELEVADVRADETLDQLEADRKLMDLSSPAKGTLYYGEIADGRWDVGQTGKFMKPGGSIPAKTVFATIIPEGGQTRLYGQVEESQLPGLRSGLEARFAPKSAPRSRIPAKLEEVAAHPDLSGKYALSFSLQAPVRDVVPGMSGRVTLVTFEADDALTIPAAAIHERPNGTLYVKVKQGEDEVAERDVTLGPEADGKVVVEEGLTAGEIVITEEKEGE